MLFLYLCIISASGITMSAVQNKKTFIVRKSCTSYSISFCFHTVWFWIGFNYITDKRQNCFLLPFSLRELEFFNLLAFWHFVFCFFLFLKPKALFEAPLLVFFFAHHYLHLHLFFFFSFYSYSLQLNP